MTTRDIAPEDVRVLYTRANYFILGPLGCFAVGQRINLPDHGDVTVTSIDPDGAGVARWGEYVESAANLPANWRSWPCYDPGFTTELSVKGMAAQCERNRREYGVTLPERLEAA